MRLVTVKVQRKTLCLLDVVLYGWCADQQISTNHILTIDTLNYIHMRTKIIVMFVTSG